MFDVGFWEMVLIAVVALLVIGPERLPEVARKTGMWVGRMRRFVTNVKADIDRELRQEELRKALERNAGLDEIKQIMNTDAFTLEEETPRPQPTDRPAPGAPAAGETEPAPASEADDADDEEAGFENDSGHADLAEEPFVPSEPVPADPVPAGHASVAESGDSEPPVKDDERRPS